MGSITTPTMTFEEFERLPDDADELELLEGELIRMPPPEADHMEICENLFFLLRPAVDKLRDTGTPIGRVHIEMGYLLTGKRSWLRPDVSITHPNQLRERFYKGAPMLVFEIVSPNDTAAKLDQKVSTYLADGSLEVWVIYPNSHHALVHDASGAVRREDWGIRSPLLPGIEIPFDSFL